MIFTYKIKLLIASKNIRTKCKVHIGKVHSWYGTYTLHFITIINTFITSYECKLKHCTLFMYPNSHTIIFILLVPVVNGFLLA